MECPTCQSTKTDKVIYTGLPMKLCLVEECNTLWGFWSWIPSDGFDGKFSTYKGSYWVAMWYWLTNWDWSER